MLNLHMGRITTYLEGGYLFAQVVTVYLLITPNYRVNYNEEEQS